MIIELTGLQQLEYLLRSVFAGAVIGVIFVASNSIARTSNRRWFVIVCDIIFCCVSSLLTFFYSLAIMDGQMHPLLFVGILTGLSLFHYAIGRHVTGFVCIIRLFLVKLKRKIKLIAPKAIGAEAKHKKKTEKYGIFFKKICLFSKKT